MIDNYTNAEFAGLGGRANARYMGMPVPGGGQALSTSVASATSTALTPGTHYMLVAETVGAFVRLGTTTPVTAALDVDLFIPPNVPMMIYIGTDTSNVDYKYLGAILRAGTGRLYITPMRA